MRNYEIEESAGQMKFLPLPTVFYPGGSLSNIGFKLPSETPPWIDIRDG